MTIIEFFDKSGIENIISTLLCAPDKLILVGHSRKKIARRLPYYHRVLANRGLSTEIRSITVGQNNLQEIYQTLVDLVEQNEKCIFDLTGGEDLYLVAVGMLLQTHRSRVQCHRFNLQNGNVTDCDADGRVCNSENIAVSIEETVMLNGGEIVREQEAGEPATCDWDWTPAFLDQIEKMWLLSRRDPRLWNAQINLLGRVGECHFTSDRIEMQIDANRLLQYKKNGNRAAETLPNLLKELERAGLIHDLTTQNRITFCFPDQQIRRCLTVAGQVLEVLIASRMIALTDKQGDRLYHDCKVGVVINWDGDGDTRVRTVNEIDVFAMQGSTPIFLSCKNGDFDSEELYKLNTVALRFGGRFAKKVLVAADLDKMGSKGEFLKARAEEMQIRIIDRITRLPLNELDRILRTL
ncbi:MAG: DUF1887 family protein [Ruminococcaceae bacterium]|nr:DUF1887 family protein [Oscillospiraceae bacterium]